MDAIVLLLDVTAFMGAVQAQHDVRDSNSRAFRDRPNRVAAGPAL
jgi:hypothetical protein